MPFRNFISKYIPDEISKEIILPGNAANNTLRPIGRQWSWSHTITQINVILSSMEAFEIQLSGFGMEWKYNESRSRKCVWKCHLQYGCKFIQVSICFEIQCHQSNINIIRIYELPARSYFSVQNRLLCYAFALILEEILKKSNTDACTGCFGFRQKTAIAFIQQLHDGVRQCVGIYNANG